MDSNLDGQDDKAQDDEGAVVDTEQEDLLDFSQDYSMANPLEHDLLRISHQHAMRMSATRDENDESKLAGDENDLMDYQSDD
jgi:anti-sigma-K factor RskA